MCMTKLRFNTYNEHQGAAAQRMQDHRFFKYFGRHPMELVNRYLLQRMFSSREFVALLNDALTRLKDDKHKDVVRCILRDEIPADKPTHFENLIRDLTSPQIGITETQIHVARMGPHTEAAIAEMHRILKVDLDNPNHDLVILALLHTAGERLVSVEYGHIVGRFSLDGANSVFYHPHFRQDAAEGDHSTLFDVAIQGLLTRDEALETAKAAIDKATEVRLSFFSQFKLPDSYF